LDSFSIGKIYPATAVGDVAAGTWVAARLISALFTSSSRRGQGRAVVPFLAMKT
jgi:hypothetical protein